MKKNFHKILTIISLVIGAFASSVFISSNLHLSNFDSMSRLNISRKIIDNLTPGLGQLGNVWPPLPQLMMLPFVAIEPLWHSGLAGTIVSLFCFVVSSHAIYLIVGKLTKNRFAQVFSVFLFITNINLLLLQSMAMSELPFIMFMLISMYSLLIWSENIQNIVQLIFAGGSIAALTLIRYEGYAFAVAAIFVVGIITWLKRRNIKATEGFMVIFGTLALFGIFLWMLYLWAIFGDPLYWAKIYSHTKSIISTDVTESVKTFADQSTHIKRNVWNLIYQYILSIAYMSGIPVFIAGIVGLLFNLINSKVWKNFSILILLLPLSIVGFMFITLARGGIPVSVPLLDWQALRNFNTTYGDEYNIRYGILLWPFIVLFVGWFVSRNSILKFLGIVLLVTHILLPFWRGGFLLYQLPIKWSTGSATSTAEDQATKWFHDNYNGGKILISAFKHDPTMFRMGIPYKDFIHEGTGIYWITSRTNPEKYAQWIFMADIKNIRGGLGGEEDSVTKYLKSVPTLDLYFQQRYNDGVIAIYERRPGVIAENDDASELVSEYWGVRSVDTMKISRDKAREWLDIKRPTSQEIRNYLMQIKNWKANYVAIDTPYDEEFYPYLKLWSDLAHELGLHVWFRGNWSAWEGWFNYKKNLSREEHLNKTYKFISTHSDLFENGDSFTPCPECENGGPGDPRTTGDAAGFRKFLIDLDSISQKAFEEIGVKVNSNWFSVNGDIARLILDRETVQKLGGVITIDHYVNSDRMRDDILWLSNNLGAKILIGEYGTGGTNNLGVPAQVYQADQLKEILQTLVSLGDKVIGVNYWVNIVGPTALLTDKHEEKPAVKVLTNFFREGTFSGKVLDEKNQPLDGVQINVNSLVATTSADGTFDVPVAPRKYVIKLTKDGYSSAQFNFDFSRAIGKNHILRLSKTVEKAWYQLLFIKN